jgi:hypothetical protein
MRLDVAPDRRLVSRAAVVSTRSATAARGERGKFVRAIVVAPLRRAAPSASIVSVVVPECEMPTATSPRPSSVALVSAMCGSFQTNATMPMRCSFCCRSVPTVALAAMP